MGCFVSESVSFLAYFPGIQSAWKIHGQGDGARVQIEIPENQMAEAIQLLAWRSKVLKFTVEVAEPDGQQQDDRKIHI